MPIDLPVGAVCAFAGQANPASGDPNNLWHATRGASKNSESVQPDMNFPVSRLEASGWMICDGRSLPCSSYSELFDVLGFLYGKKTNSSGDSFAIPDYRGLFLRGVDGGSGMDPDAATRIASTGEGNSPGIGSLQCFAMEQHTHGYTSIGSVAPAQQGAGLSTGLAQPGEHTSMPEDPALVAIETRPKNIAVNYIIRFR